MSKKDINWIEAAMKNRQIVLALILSMVLLGIFSLLNMPRSEYPEFTVRTGLVVGVYPGASSDEVEDQLTEPVENYIFSYEEVDKEETRSISKEGQMIVFVELREEVNNSDEFWSKFRHGLEELKAQLPTGVLALQGNNNFGNTSALLITMSSDEKSYRELEEVMEELQQDIRKIPAGSRIQQFGMQQEEIYVYVKPEKLNQYNIDPATVFASFKLQESLKYSGSLDNRELVLPVHLPQRFESEEDLKEQIIYTDPSGDIVRLKDVARIERRYEDPDSYIQNNGNNALLLSLEMQKGNNIVQFGEDVQQVLDQFSAHTDDDVQLNVISSLPNVVDSAISHFMLEFLYAILGVLLVTLILLPFHVAILAGITIPISVLMSLGILDLLGIQLHIVSLAGLITVLGMVVDNAIVVIDDHIVKLDEGESPWEAAWKSATELVMPVLSATAAIVAAFLPLMFYLTGIGGDFVGSFPVTIAVTLGISMLVAIFLVPLLCFVFIKTGLGHDAEETEDEGEKKQSFLDKVQHYYDQLIEWTFKNSKITLGIGAFTVALGIFIFTTVPQQLFPAMERSQFPVEIYLPEGTSLEQTEVVVDSLTQILIKDERVTNVTSFAGTGSPRFNDLYAPSLPGENIGQLMVNTISNEATIEILDEYSVKYRNTFPTANIKWKQLALENFESPIEVRISGDDIPTLKQITDSVSYILQQHDQTTWVRNDWKEMRQGLNIDLDRNKANQLGYAKTLVAASLMTSLNGLPLTTIWEGDYPVDVLFIKEEAERDNVNDLEDHYISSPLTMESIPLRSIATIKPEWTEGTIVRRNGVRTVTVQSELERGVIASKVFQNVQPLIDQIELPQGFTIEYGGDHEESIKNLWSLTYSLLTSVIIIFFILIFEFKTIRRVLLIMSTMLMGILGAALGLKLTGYPFGMTSFIGLIGLIGIVVRNGIILIDYGIQLVDKEGYSYKEAAMAAGKRRMRPIFLTAMAAAMGVIPMILSGSPLWGPLGTVICFGLIVGMVITLVVLPVLYWKVSVIGRSEDQLPAA